MTSEVPWVPVSGGPGDGHSVRPNLDHNGQPVRKLEFMDANYKLAPAPGGGWHYEYEGEPEEIV